MSATRLQALSYLAYRALLAHPLKMARRKGSGLERFLANYEGEGLLPTRPGDREIANAAAACISCGLCEPGCAVAESLPAVRAFGLHAVFRLYSKSTGALRFAGDALASCSGCAGCEALCPTGVPIGRILSGLMAEVAEHPAWLEGRVR